MRGSEAPPSHERQPQSAGSGLNVPLEDVLVIHWLAVWHALKYQRLRSLRLDRLIFSDLQPRPKGQSLRFQAEQAVNYFWRDSAGRRARLSLGNTPIAASVAFLECARVIVNTSPLPP